MGLLERLFGAAKVVRRPPESTTTPVPSGARPLTDDQALERYRYMLRTAPPETIEQAHVEAFAWLTPDQRRQVLAELARAAPPEERASVKRVSADDPNALGQLATRTELRQPGFMERTLLMGGPTLGLGGSLLGSFAMGFVGSMVAQSFLSSIGGFGPALDPGYTSDDTTPTDPRGDTYEYGPDNAEAGQSDFGDDGGDDGDLGGSDFEM